MSIQDTNLQRVKSRLADGILEFAGRYTGQEFRMETLRRYLMGQGIAFAPASPDRILRELRKQGLITYTVVSRAGSLYRINSVTTHSEALAA